MGSSTDSTVSHVFEIPNRTAVPIRLSIGEKSCGCTSCELNKDVLEPGEIGQATVTMRLQATTGPRRETVVVQSDNEIMPRVHLTLECNVVANLTVSFPNHQSTSMVRPGTKSSIRGTVVSIHPASESMVPVEIRVTNPKFRLKQLDMNEESHEVGVRKTINFEVSMTCPESDDSEFVDSFIGRIVARAGNDETGSDIVFNVDAPIRLTPKRVFLAHPTNAYLIVCSANSLSWKNSGSR